MAINYPFPQGNQGQNISPFHPQPHRSSLSNKSIIGNLEQPTTTKLLKDLKTVTFFSWTYILVMLAA